jgi:hypothetical protein
MVFLLLPFAALLIAYVTFLGLGSTGSHVFTTLFTIGYLLGQAVSVAFVALVLVRSQRRLGGIMRSKVLLLLLIPLTQHVADLNFLFQAHQRTWVMGSYGDVLYLVSYGLMTLAILNISTTSLAAAQRSKALADSTAIDTDTGLPTPSERLRLAANTP